MTAVLHPAGGDFHVPAAQKPSHIVVPVDFSSATRRALGVAAVLAQRLALPLRLITVQPSGVAADEFRRERERLDEVVQSLIEAYPTPSAPETKVVCGDDTGQAIIDDDHGAIVVIGSDKANRRSTLRTSVTDGVVRAARHQPVVVVGPAAKLNGQSGPIAVMLDGSPVAEVALPSAVAWAAALHRPVALVQVLDSATAAVAKRDGDGIRSAYLLAVQRELENEGVAARARLVVSEEPIEAIVGQLSELDAPLAFLASHASQGLEREAFGSTAMGVAIKSSCPVAIVRARLDRVARLSA